MVRPTNRDVNPVRCKQTRGGNHQPNISLPIGNESKMFFPLEVDFALKSLINGTSIDLIGHQLTPHCRPRCLTFLAEAQRDRFVQELKLNQKRKKKKFKRGWGVPLGWGERTRACWKTPRPLLKWNTWEGGENFKINYLWSHFSIVHWVNIYSKSFVNFTLGKTTMQSCSLFPSF